MRCSNKTLGLFLFFLLVGFITGQGMATDLEDHNFWGLTADDVLGVDEDSSNIDVLRRMFYQSNPETGTLHPDIKFSNLDVYWEDFWDTEELVFQFDLIAPAAIAYGGFYCRHTNGLPIGGSEQGFTCSSFEYATNQIAAPEKLVEALVPGETYAWNAFIIYEDEVIESPLSYFVYEDVRYDDRVEGPNTPVILMQSEDLTADQWDEVTLIVLADVPRGELAYQWYRSPTRANRGGIRIDGATQSYYVAPTEEALSQYYYCTVTNVADSSYGTELTTVASKSIEVNLRPVEKGTEYAYLDFGVKLASAGRRNVVLKVPWSEGHFKGAAITFNKDLAVVSLALSQAAYSKTNVRRALESLGFDQIELDYNEGKRDKEYVAAAFGCKRYESAGKTTNVVAVVLRGTTDWIEWADNFVRGSKGFAGAEELVWISLVGYLGRLEPADELKFLVTGHSRGAAVANILGARLTNSVFGSNRTVFVYSFATPNTTSRRDREFYQNVMSWSNENDPVCSLPLGLEKHGISRTFSLKEDPGMNYFFKRLTGGKDLSDYGPVGNVKSSHAPETYLAFLLTINPDVSID